MEELNDDIMIYMMCDILEPGEIFNLFSTCHRMLSYKSISNIRKKITYKLLGSRGIEIMNEINNRDMDERKLVLSEYINDLFIKRIMLTLNLYDLKPIYFTDNKSNILEFMKKNSCYVAVSKTIYLENQDVSGIGSIFVLANRLYKANYLQQMYRLRREYSHELK
ncbi:hypothetical protein QKU48_gp1013 [Fadolivirus algeromassiliense]|jgi:hypothetical protein|uniref:Uncharacterized protein n=1 Tax=Fadolivirus FV1/VV64 TaxID=3070911 RepID=A0A7D3UUX5_9VIRU|nr:hypothetical protein QKU48_gp1013 [Fadolivirus algeromassiliense]QKF94471.1 hypothetical protein Fadolivirus_1_1013 [Fadolivirus FV1/VV64]